MYSTIKCVRASELKGSTEVEVDKEDVQSVGINRTCQW